MERLTIRTNEASISFECESVGDIVRRLAAIEDILGDDYDLDRLSVLVNQRMTMREDVAARMKLVGGIPLDRLRELVEADQEGRCVVLPCKPGEFVFANVLRKGQKKTVPLCVRRIDVVKAADPEMSTECVFLSMLHEPLYFTDFGRCVFTNREDAEAALKGERE